MAYSVFYKFILLCFHFLLRLFVLFHSTKKSPEKRFFEEGALVVRYLAKQFWNFINLKSSGDQALTTKSLFPSTYFFLTPLKGVFFLSIWSIKRCVFSLILTNLLFFGLNGFCGNGQRLIGRINPTFLPAPLNWLTTLFAIRAIVP